MQGGLDLPPVLDFEETGGLAPGSVAQWARTWLQEVERLTGRTPMIYTGYYFWRDSVGGPTDFGRYPLWVASWTNAPAPALIPSGWSTWTFWQYTSTGSSAGIPWTTDLNRFCCPDANLGLLAGGGNAAFSNPFGAVDGATRRPDRIDVSGWAIDPDTTASIPVHVYVDGTIAGATTANNARPDVGGAFPGFGGAHGFSFSTPVGPGPHTVSAYAINAGPGNTNSLLGCQTLSSDPIGSLDAVVARARRQREGRRLGARPRHRRSRSGRSVRQCQAMGLRHGQRQPSRSGERARSVEHRSRVLDRPERAHDPGRRVRVRDQRRARNASHPGLQVDRCPSRSPGSFDAAQVADNGIQISGWALDPDRSGSIPVHVYVDGRFDRAVPPRPLALTSATPTPVGATVTGST